MSRTEVVITPTAEQYAQLVDDLGRLRERGAVSNTAAILDAVRRAAYAEQANETPRQRRHAPGPDNGR